MKYIYESFRNDIWTGYSVRRFQSYKFKGHVLKVKIFRQRLNFNNFFGYLMTSEVKGHFYKIDGNLVEFM